MINKIKLKAPKNLATYLLAFYGILLCTALFQVFIGKPIKNPNRVEFRDTSRWCKVGEHPKRDKCIDGSGSGA